MFLVIIFFAGVEYTLNLWSSLAPTQLIAFAQQRDNARRGPAPFAAVGGEFEELYVRSPALSLPDVLSASAVEIDAHGLLPIHYTVCEGVEKEVHFLAQFGEGYRCVAQDENRYRLFELPLKRCHFGLARDLLLETRVS
jgi:hypothetical protein